MSEMFRFLIGREKLCRPRPSTAAFGNWGILQGVTWVRDNIADDTSLSARLFMGKGLKSKKDACNATPSDDAERRAELWAALRTEFLRDDTGAFTRHRPRVRLHTSSGSAASCELPVAGVRLTPACPAVWLPLTFSSLLYSSDLPPEEPLRAVVRHA